MGTGVNIFSLILHSSGTCFVNWQLTGGGGKVWKESQQIFSSVVVAKVKKICSFIYHGKNK